MEELAVDKRVGFFVNHDLAGYEVPVHADIPHQEVIFLDETDPMSSPMKAKGVGELGICGVGAAIANAVYNATGARVREYPITLDKQPAGSASAAASVTMPRMPDQEMTRPLPTVGRSMGRGGWKPKRRWRQRMTALKDMCQASRTAITVASTAAATSRYWLRAGGASSTRIGRICRPMKMKAKMLSAKITVAHTALVGMRMRAEMRAGASAGSVMAKHTVVSTPDRPACSASSHTVKVPTNCRMIAVGMCCTRSIRRCMSQPSAGPATRLPSTASRKRRRHCLDGEAAGRHRAHGQAIDQQRAGVVQQAFAFQHGQDALRRMQRAQHRGGRHRIGRRDDGAERDGGGPGHARHQRMGDDGDRRRREADGDHHQADQRRPVVAQVAQGASKAASSRTGATNSASTSSGGSDGLGAPGTKASSAPPIASHIGPLKLTD
jgi:hypothetical protein